MKKLAARARRSGSTSGSRNKVKRGPKRKVLRTNGKQQAAKSRNKTLTRKQQQKNQDTPPLRRGDKQINDKRANRSIDLLDSEDDSSYYTADDGEDNSFSEQAVKKTGGRSSKHRTDDEEYIPSDSDSDYSNDDGDDDDESFVDDDLARTSKSPASKRTKKTKDAADYDSVSTQGSKDSNTSNEALMDDDDHSSYVDDRVTRRIIDLTGTTKTRTKECRKKCPNTSYSPDDDDEMSNVFSRDETDDDDEVSPRSRRVCCQSKVDAITDCKLELIHVCWTSPDGENKQCYNLNTLRKVSLAREKEVLLEPPHFRCDISIKLQDQIVSKFGRTGLKVRHPTSDDDDESNDDDDIDDDSFFHERFNSYMHELMGSRDIYVCPICYCYKYNTLAGITVTDDNVCDLITSRSFKYDPMSILIDEQSDDNFHVASTFCFRLVKEVKHHITAFHNIDLSHIKGNDLFKGFQIRAPDGLLQRWLKQRYPRTIDAQDMRRYWADGNNRLDYLELAFLVDHDQSLRRTDHQFFESFQDQSQTLWEMISGAFERLENDELEDFIVEEGGETDASIESGPRNINMFNEDSDPEEEFVKRLRARRAADSSSNTSISNNDDVEHSSSNGSMATEDNSDSQLDSSDGDSEAASVESEEEEDEWLSQKLVTPKKKKMFSSPLQAKTNSSSGKLSKLRKLSAESSKLDSDSDQVIREIIASDVEVKEFSSGRLLSPLMNKKRVQVITEALDSDSEMKKVPPGHSLYSVIKKKRVLIDEFDDSE